MLVQQIDFESADNNQILFAINKIRLGSMNYYSPTFMVFVSTQYVDIESPEFDVYNDLETWEDVDARVRTPSYIEMLQNFQ